MVDKQDQNDLQSIETLFHDIATPLVISKMKAELLAKYLPSIIRAVADSPALCHLLPEEQKHIDALVAAPEIMLSNLLLVQKKINLLSAAIQHQASHFAPSNDTGSHANTGVPVRTAAIKRILLVDDEPVHRDIGASLLLPHYEVDFASNGLEAINFCEQKHYDLILMDLHMPRMNGEQATITLRSRISHETIIIGLTSLPIGVNKSGLLAMGFTDFLEKPLTLTGLQKLLRTHSLNA